MNPETLVIVVVFVAFIGAVIMGSTGESPPLVPMTERAVYYPRVPVSSAISP